MASRAAAAATENSLENRFNIIEIYVAVVSVFDVVAAIKQIKLENDDKLNVVSAPAVYYSAPSSSYHRWS